MARLGGCPCTNEMTLEVAMFDTMLQTQYNLYFGGQFQNKAANIISWLYR